MVHAQAPEGAKSQKGHRKGPHGGPPPKIIAKFDADGDGKLNEEERKAAREAMKEHHRQKMLEKFDTNGDGQLSHDERKAARKAHGKHRKHGKGPGPEGTKPTKPVE